MGDNGDEREGETIKVGRVGKEEGGMVVVRFKEK